MGPHLSLQNSEQDARKIIRQSAAKFSEDSLRTIIRVAIYARVSTTNHGQDVGLQIGYLREFAEARGVQTPFHPVHK